MSVRSLSALRLLAIGRDTEDVGNDVSSLCRLTFRLHLHRDLNVRKRFRIWVIFRILSETLSNGESRQLSISNNQGTRFKTYLEDDEVVEGNLSNSNTLAEILQVVMNLLNNHFGSFVTLEDVVERFPAEGSERKGSIELEIESG